MKPDLEQTSELSGLLVSTARVRTEFGKLAFPCAIPGCLPAEKEPAKSAAITQEVLRHHPLEA